MSRYYIWRDGKAVQVANAVECFRTASDGDKDIGYTFFGYDDHGSPITVSTVFLCFDHSFIHGPHDPVLWETMIFGLPDDHPMAAVQERYDSRAQAQAGHAEICSALAGMLDRLGEEVDREHPPWRQSDVTA